MLLVWLGDSPCGDRKGGGAKVSAYHTGTGRDCPVIKIN